MNKKTMRSPEEIAREIENAINEFAVLSTGEARLISTILYCIDKILFKDEADNEK